MVEDEGGQGLAWISGGGDQERVKSSWLDGGLHQEQCLSKVSLFLELLWLLQDRLFYLYILISSLWSC